MRKIKLVLIFAVSLLVFSGCASQNTSQNKNLDIKVVPSAATTSLDVITPAETEPKTEVPNATSTPLVYPAKDTDWKVIDKDSLNNSSLFLGKDYKYPKNWFVGDDGAGWGGIIVFSDQKWVENSSMILSQYLGTSSKPVYNECTLVIELKNTDPIFGDEPDNYAKTLLTVKKYNSKVDKSEELICDRILNFMDKEIQKRVVYYKH